jgi:hypothetical protein
MTKTCAKCKKDVKTGERMVEEKGILYQVDHTDCFGVKGPPPVVLPPVLPVSAANASAESVNEALKISEGRKDDQGKPACDLLPPAALLQVAQVLAFGAYIKGYGPDNWRKVSPLRSRYLAAALRHVFAYMKGEKNDPESGCHHLAHAVCCLLFMLEAGE